MGVGSICDYGCHADVMRMSCGGWLIGSLAPRLPIAPLLDTNGGEGSGCRRCLLLSGFYRLPLSLACGADGADLLACSYAVGRFRSAVCDARILWIVSLRLPWLLRRDIFISCRRGRTSAIAAHRNFFRLFFYSDFRSALLLPPLSSTLIATGGHFQSFHARLLMGRSFRRASPRPLYPWRTGRGVFMPIISAASSLKRRRRIR